MTYGRLVEVSSLGRVRQFAWKRRTWRLRKPKVHKSGYLMVTVSVGVPRTHKIHHLVAEAWYGPRPEGMDTAHKNGVKADNRPENLMYCSRQANLRHRIGHGTSGSCPVIRMVRGRVRYLRQIAWAKSEEGRQWFRDRATNNAEHMRQWHATPAGQELHERLRRKTAKLDEARVLSMREMYARGEMDQPRLAVHFGVSQNTVSLIVSGKKWKSASGPILTAAERTSMGQRRVRAARDRA